MGPVGPIMYLSHLLGLPLFIRRFPLAVPKTYSSLVVTVSNCRIVVEGNRERKRRDDMQRKLY